MDEITELCNEHNFPLLIAVQLYTNKTDGARIAAQSVETKTSVLPFKISSKLLRGEAKIALDSESSFYVQLADEEGNYNNASIDNFDEPQLETLQEHSAHCDECREQMEQRVLAGEDISDIRIINDHDEYDSFQVDEMMLPMLAGFFNPKNKIVH